MTETLKQACFKSMYDHDVLSRVCTCVMDPALKECASGPFPVDALARSWMVGIGDPAGKDAKKNLGPG